MAGRGPAETGPRLPTAATAEPAEPEPRASQCQDQRRQGRSEHQPVSGVTSPVVTTLTQALVSEVLAINPVWRVTAKVNN